MLTQPLDKNIIIITLAPINNDDKC